jgi:flagellar hook-associated protein 2
MSALGVGSSTASNLLASAANGTNSSSSAATLSFTGLASGVNTNAIITAIETFSTQQMTALQTQGQGYANIQSAFSTLQGDLTSLQSSVNQLAVSADSAITGLSATPSDANAMAATAGTAAVPGSYTVTVQSLAQENQVASQGFADPNVTLQQGTMTIQVGSNSPINITLNSQNDTLQGLASAINAAGGDVQASIINDGSSTPYRLLLTATTPGAANTIAVTTNLSGSGASINPTQTTVQPAADAQVTMGSGPGARTVTSPNDTVSGLIPGVTLNLLQANPNQPITVSVANNTSGAASAVQNFVTAYNAVIDYINQNSSYNTATQQAGLFLGNATSSSLASALASAMGTAGFHTASGQESLGSIGLSFNQSGDLQFNQSTFTEAMNKPGGPQAILNLFAMSGTSDNPGVQFITGSGQTQPSGATPYTAQITAPATQGTAVASNALASSNVITSANNTFTLQVEGVKSAPISITPGTYTPDQLTAQMQQQINASNSLNGNLVAVTVNGDGKLQITSQLYGAASSVVMGTGTAVGSDGPLGFNGGESGTGTDVAGDFLVNGQVEKATGYGQYLTGNSGNANTAGLEVQSTLSAPGSAKLTVAQGLAGQLNQVLNNYLNPVSGQLVTVNNQYQTEINNINSEITADNSRLQRETTTLQQRFAAMETTVNNLKNVQAELAGLVSSSSSSSSSSGG